MFSTCFAIESDTVRTPGKMLDSLPITTSFDSLVECRVDRDFLPKPFDWLTNLPGDWVTWTKNSFNKKHLPVMFAVVYSTALTIVTDYETWQPFKKQYEKDKTFRDVNDFFSYLGDGKVQFGLAGAFATFGIVAGDNRALRTGSQIVEVILASGAVVQLLKHTTGRESPFVATTPTGRWDFFPNQIEYAKHVPHYDAFPSGHLATALATLTVVAENYPEQKWIKWIGYPVMAGISIGLVSQSIHWWSDFPLSIVLGYSFGKLVAHPQEMETPKKAGELDTDIGMTIMRDGSLGVGFAMSW